MVSINRNSALLIVYLPKHIYLFLCKLDPKYIDPIRSILTEPFNYYRVF